MDLHLENNITKRGHEFFASISGEAPSIFNKGWWTGKVMDWAMKHEDFKVQLFRFVDVLPYLNTSESLLRHIREYFASGDIEVPTAFKLGASAAGIGGMLPGKVVGATVRGQIEGMGRQFIIGENVREATKALSKLRKDGFAFTVDLLGEASVNEIPLAIATALAISSQLMLSSITHSGFARRALASSSRLSAARNRAAGRLGQPGSAS